MTPILDAALDYHGRGWRVVHVAAGAKRPTMAAWPTLQPTAEDISRWFARPANVGVALGEPSGGLTDVDLDCPEAVELAAEFLPVTWAFGRASKPRSHWLYIVPGAEKQRTKQFRDDDGKVMIEIRGTGGQSVCPPSFHPSGEAIEWDASSREQMPDGPRVIDAQELRERVVRLAMAAVLVRAGWTADDACERAIQEQPPPRPQCSGHPRRVRAGADVLERARRYLAKMPPAISGQGGHEATWRAAMALTRGFGLSEEEAFALLWTDFNPRCDPPWSERELRHKVVDAANRAAVPFGYLVDDGRNVRHA